MRLATFRKWNVERAALVTKSGLLPLTALGLRAGFEPEGEILPLIEKEQLEPLTEWYNAGGKAEAETLAEKEAIPYGEAVYGPLYRNPQRIFGIGLNYKDHAGDLGEKTPQVFPGSFYKPASCIAGPGDEIKIPALPEAQKTTAEAELGVIIGKKCKFIEEKDWLKYVAGYTTILDMTEESILRLNPRYLTIVKGFDTFFTFGPQLVTPDEIPDVSALEVATPRRARLAHAGLAARRHTLDRNAARGAHPGRRRRGVPHHGAGRLRLRTARQPGNRPENQK